MREDVDRQRIRHLLRRFGFGASPDEAATIENLGLDEAIRLVVDYGRIKEEFDVDVWPFHIQADGRCDLGPWTVNQHWVLKLLACSRSPAEKLVLFWHDHFGIGADKVDFGPAMLGYLEVLRRHANGRFADPLYGVATSPAMLWFLDGRLNMKGRPNENFGRELLELYTLGIGHYTEKDVREASRACTGWSTRNAVWELPDLSPDAYRKTVEAMRSAGTPFIASTFSLEMFDGAEKEVLGKKKAYDLRALCDELAVHPQTARHLAKKLWEWYAYPDPGPEVLRPIEQAYLKEGGSIEAARLAIAKHSAFWSSRARRALIKNPVDLMAGAARQMGVGRSLLAAAKAGSGDLAKPVRDSVGWMSYMLERQGMDLLWPPDVAGWNWGTAWISADSLMRRAKAPDFVFWASEGEGKPFCRPGLRRLAESATSDQAYVEALLDLFDAEVSDDQRAILADACRRGGGASAARDGNNAGVAHRISSVLFASPGFQFF